jgi:hypothetical protein
MASIDSVTFDQESYNPGDVITITVAYTPDTPGVNPVVFTATANVSDSSGVEVATSSAQFVVNEAVLAGDTVSVTDTGNRAWTQSSDSGSVAVFTASA